MAINYIEKGAGLHQKIAKAGYTLMQVNRVWVADDDVAVQAIVDVYTLDECADYIAGQIDDHAQKLRHLATAGSTAEEMASWTIKRAEALLYKSTANPLDAPNLTEEASYRNVTLDKIVDRVLLNASKLSPLESAIAGVAGRHKDAVRDNIVLDTFAKKLAYDWSTGWPSV